MLVIPAGASGPVLSITFTNDGSHTTVSSNSGVYGRLEPIEQVSHWFNGGYRWYGIDRVTVDPDSWVSGTLGIYLSVFMSSDNPNTYFQELNPSVVLKYTDDVGSSVTSPVSVSTFVPSVDPNLYPVVSQGYRFKSQVNLSAYAPVSDYYFLGGNQFRLFSNESAGQFNALVSYFVPSVSFIVSESPDDLAALEGIADGIAAQSQVLNSMYGDIMALLNDLYARLGSIQQVQEVANSYFSQMIPLLQGINTNTANIYSLLQTQFQLLRTLIATESDDIQAAIDQQTEDLIAYFDTVFSDSVGDMPEKSDDLNTSVGDVSDAESGYQSTATQRFDQLTDTFSGGFSGGILAGVTLAATLFTRVWNALGDYVIVYTWPLFLGLCLVILGRMSRLSGGQSSSEKHRGDSDA